MLRRGAFVVFVALVVCGLWAVGTGADEVVKPGTARLMDRGDAANVAKEAPSGQALLSRGAGTPGATPAVINVGQTVPVGAYAGYFFARGADIPTAWLTFNITGVFGFKMVPGPSPAPPVTDFVAAGAAPGPFPPTTVPAWIAFSSFPFPPVGTLFPPGVMLGGPGLFSPGPVVFAPFGCACGLRQVAPPPLHLLGGIAPASPQPLFEFQGPPATTVYLTPISAPPADWVVGCYASGATVPVELQAFSVE